MYRVGSHRTDSQQAVVLQPGEDASPYISSCYKMLHRTVDFGTPFLEHPEQWCHIVDKRNARGFFVGKHEGKRPFGRCRARSEDTIKVELIEIGWEDVDCINLVQGRESMLAVLNVWNFFIS